MGRITQTVPPATVTATTAATHTPEPTATPRPTSMPDLAATQQFQGWEAGYLASPKGEFLPREDWSQDGEQIN